MNTTSSKCDCATHPVAGDGMEIPLVASRAIARLTIHARRERGGRGGRGGCGSTLVSVAAQRIGFAVCKSAVCTLTMPGCKLDKRSRGDTAITNFTAISPLSPAPHTIHGCSGGGCGGGCCRTPRAVVAPTSRQPKDAYLARVSVEAATCLRNIRCTDPVGVVLTRVIIRGRSIFA